MIVLSAKRQKQRRVDGIFVKPLLCAAVLRVALLVAAYLRTGTEVLTQGDTTSYVTPGVHLFLHGMYGTAGMPELDRTPGYPVFLMLSGMLHGNVLLTAWIQIALSLVSLLLIGRIAAVIFRDEQAGVIAAWLYAVEPASIVYSIRLLPETLFVLLFLMFLDRLLTYMITSRLSSLATAGLMLSIATYVRPVSYYLCAPIAVGIVFHGWRTSGHRWKAPAILLLTVLPLLAVWQIRNRVETGYGGFSSIVEKNLYFYQSAQIAAEMDHVSLAEEQVRLGYPDEASYVAVHPEQKDWSQVKRLRYMHDQAMQVLATNRLRYLKTHLAGSAVVAFTPCASELLQLIGAYPTTPGMPKRVLNDGVLASVVSIIRSHPGVAAMMILLESILLMLFAAMFVALIQSRGHRMAMMTLCGVALYFLLVSGGAQAVGRYRVPVMPELCILAGGGIALRVARQRRSDVPLPLMSTSR